MTRYFYTDPLAAAWMTLHHDFQFEFPLMYATGTQVSSDDQGKELGRKCVGMLEWPWEDGPRRFYVHPDSLHLLEPSLGDVVASGNQARTVCGNQVNQANVPVGFISMANATHLVALGARAIIQRDGKPFHWPESDSE